MSAHILQGPELEFSIKEKTLGQFYFNNCDKYADQICQVDGTYNKTESYASVKLRSIRVAIALQKKNVTSKDVITLCSSNTLDNTIPIIAGAFLGANITNLEASLSVRHTKHLLSLVTPKIIFVEESSVDLMENSLEGASFKTEIIVLGNSEKYTTFSSLLKKQEKEEEFYPVDVDPNDIAMMFFSSGTTGLPKAICHSHATLLRSICSSSQCGFRGVLLHFTTFYWMTATLMLTCSFKCGSYRVFCRNPSAEDVFKIIEKYKVEVIFTAPILTYQLTSFEKYKTFDTSSLKMIICGGTSIAITQLEKMKDVFKSALVCQGYGMSEVGWITGFDMAYHKELTRTELASCGKPSANTKIKVVDVSTEKLLGPNQKGEIRIWSPSLMCGYYKLDSSAQFDADGFLKSGDLGYYDEDDCLYISGRFKEMFKYQSWHIVPSSIEAVLLEHPLITEAVVFGLPSDKDGDVPAASVVLKEEDCLTEKEIDEFLKGRVADRERLRGGVTFMKVLPKTPTGKVPRNNVRDLVIKLQNGKN